MRLRRKILEGLCGGREERGDHYLRGNAVSVVNVVVVYVFRTDQGDRLKFHIRGNIQLTSRERKYLLLLTKQEIVGRGEQGRDIDFVGRGDEAGCGRGCGPEAVGGQHVHVPAEAAPAAGRCSVIGQVLLLGLLGLLLLELLLLDEVGHELVHGGTGDNRSQFLP